MKSQQHVYASRPPPYGAVPSQSKIAVPFISNPAHLPAAYTVYLSPSQPLSSGLDARRAGPSAFCRTLCPSTHKHHRTRMLSGLPSHGFGYSSLPP